ncbi:MFS transporter [Rhodococcus sp. IEGM 248]|uniref:MFS transporter n=1 Tax=Rhodococcus sp. IEGM 1305 TaxID=3047092 RepID=UPI00120E6B6C|nr:MFS transporter [Rhodococcus sp. IEGM 1305]MDI9949248.1 MFS transporter [Rhodococcus sp. IEGM 1305]NDV07988.1 MFS transporter [Rhodococcus sp. IEGM 248]RZL85093.1 MAG: MFS transporter [Rhodococcus sp. (in: high G+C Gram-positive bacteria)]
MPTDTLRTGARRPFTSLRVRNFRLFFVGQLVSATGQWMQTLALALFVLDESGSGVALGMVTLLMYLPLLVVAPWIGAALERLPLRNVLLVSQAVQAALAAILWSMSAIGTLTVPLALTVAACVGLVQPVDNPARRSFVFEMVGRERVANAVALNSTLMTTSRLVGPAIAGLLASTVGLSWCFLANALSYLVILGALALMRTRDLHTERTVTGTQTTETSSHASALDGFRYALRDPGIRWPLVLTAVVSLLLQNYSVLLPLLAHERMSTGASSAGLLFSALSAGSLLSALTVATLAPTGTRVVAVSALCYGIVVAATSFTSGMAVLAMLLVLLGAADQVFSSTANATLQIQSDPRYRVRVMSLFSAFFIGMQGVSGVLVGALADLFGPTAAMTVGGVGAIVVAAIVLGVNRRRRPLQDRGNNGALRTKPASP